MRPWLSLLVVAGAAVVLCAAAPAAEPDLRPTVKLLGARLTGARVYARLRVCDDARSGLVIFARDSRRGVVSATRRFATGTRRTRCAAYSRSWIPARRFVARGNYVVTIWARDAAGRTSTRLQTTFLR
jgi:hypothetical protein